MICAGSVLAQEADPDALYRQRADIARAKEAASIWETRLASNPRDFESAWKIARVTYWLGEHDAPEARRKWLERGVAAGKTAASLEPKRPEGHFWMAANMGALAESFGLRQGLKYRGDIRDELLTVLKLDAGFQEGSADRALGRWYFRVPGLLGGSKKKSEEHLRRSLAYDPTHTLSLLFLAETLIALDREAEARQTLQKLLDAPIDPQWVPEDRENKEKARQLLAKTR